jgi:hypothetical protein
MVVCEPTRDGELVPATALRLTGLRHLVGVVGVGKSVLLELVVAWLAERGYRVLLLVPSIATATERVLAFEQHGLSAGLLYGEGSRGQHADHVAQRIASLEAATGGFGLNDPATRFFGGGCLLRGYVEPGAAWPLTEAPCRGIEQEVDGKRAKLLCPFWSRCGRKLAPRQLTRTDVWVGHIRSTDTAVAPHATDSRLQYFELVGRTFDIVLIDEADQVQDTLDDYGWPVVTVSGEDTSTRARIGSGAANAIAAGDNAPLADPRNAEFHNRYHDWCRIDNGLLHLLQRDRRMAASTLAELDDLWLSGQSILTHAVQPVLPRGAAEQMMDATRLWFAAAAFAIRRRQRGSAAGRPRWTDPARRAEVTRLTPEQTDSAGRAFVAAFSDLLADPTHAGQNRAIERLQIGFQRALGITSVLPRNTRRQLCLAALVTLHLDHYQWLVRRARAMSWQDANASAVLGTLPSTAVRDNTPQPPLATRASLQFTYEGRRELGGSEGRFRISLSFAAGFPRRLLADWPRLFEGVDGRPGPAVLAVSASSVLEPSPAYHIAKSPDYVLRPQAPHPRLSATRYRFRPLVDPDQGLALRHSGAGARRDKNLRSIVRELFRGGVQGSEPFAERTLFEQHEEPRRKIVLVTQSYRDVEIVLETLETDVPDVWVRAKGVSRARPQGRHSAFIARDHVEFLGDDVSCDVIVLPMTALGRGINIVFRSGPRVGEAAVGQIYFLTRPHPTGDDLQLVRSLAGEAVDRIEAAGQASGGNLEVIEAEEGRRLRELRRAIRHLERQQLMASRLPRFLLRPFTANLLPPILQMVGRGMRGGCPVLVTFVDAAWAPRSANQEPDTARTSLLVAMHEILEECWIHPDPGLRAVYREIYGPFIEPFRRVEGLRVRALRA